MSLDFSPVHGEVRLLVSGSVTGQGGDDRASEHLETDLGVVFNSGGQPRRTTAADRTGRFSTQVPNDVDEIWIVSATRRVRAQLSLTGAP